MLEKVISGFQSGADIAGILAARDHGVPTGGYMTLGCKTEDGPRTRYVHEFGAVELETPDYPDRTHRNAGESDGTVWFGDADSSGFGCTAGGCKKAGKPIFKVVKGETTPREVVEWIREHRIKILNVAGSRASKAPLGFERDVREFLGRVLRSLGHQRTAAP